MPDRKSLSRDRLTPRRMPLSGRVMALWLMAFPCLSSWAQDVVVVRSKDTRTVATRKGEVVDYTGELFAIRYFFPVGELQNVEVEEIEVKLGRCMYLSSYLCVWSLGSSLPCFNYGLGQQKHNLGF